MGRIARVVMPGCPHHVLQRAVRALEAFYSDEDREEYLRLMAEQGRVWGVEFLSYCLMNDHVHLVAIPATEEGLARAIGEAHRRYTRSLNHRLGARGYLFQGRFYSCPLDPSQAASAIRYVERNPVRANLTAQAWDYAWSSAGLRVGLRERDTLVRARNLIEPEMAWRDLLAEDPENLALLRERTRTGRPFGDMEFIYHAETLTGRVLRPLPPGRPRKGETPPTERVRIPMPMLMAERAAPTQSVGAQ